MKQEIFSIPITTVKKGEILEEIRKYLKNFQFSISNFQLKKNQPLIIFTPNPEIIAYSYHDGKFKEIVAKAQINIPDGTGVVWALQRMYGVKVEKIAGVDFMRELCGISDKNAYRIGLIGGREKVALSVAECLKRSYNNLKVHVFDAPVIEIKNKKLKIKNYHNKQATKLKELEDKYFLSLGNEIIKRKIDILFVALGHPKQEYFIENLKAQMSNVKKKKPVVLMAVGGSFDYLSGRIPRAPQFMKQVGFEWLYRFMKEPWRFSRQLRGLEFFYRVLTIRNPNTS